ncbi:MAG: amidohydrolase family protein [Clostridia bacterium]|nr:amidohydrolase family protein [Clostridia bacterium]
MATYIKCGQLFAAKDETVLKDMAVVVDGNKIVKVAPAAELAPEADWEVLDLSGKFVMPGLIDAHLHVGMSGEPDTSAYSHYSGYGEIALTAMLNAQADLMAGFTTIRSEGDINFIDVDLKKMINTGKVWGPRMFVSGVPLSSTGGHGDSHFRPDIDLGGMAFKVDNPDQCRAAARKVIKYGADQIKLMATGGVMSMGDEPGAPELTYEEMKTICDLAKSHGKLTTAHAHGAAGIKNAIKAGITSIEHGMLIDDEGIQMLADYGTYLIPTVIAAYQIVANGVEAGIPAWGVEKAERCLKNHGENLKKMRKLGVKIGFGTDAATPYNKHGEQGFEFELMTRYGDFTPVETLLAATKVNSEMLRWDDKIGSIEEGKLADIVAFDVSPLEDITVMKNCTFVMKDGVVYKK